MHQHGNAPWLPIGLGGLGQGTPVHFPRRLVSGILGIKLKLCLLEMLIIIFAKLSGRHKHLSGIPSTGLNMDLTPMQQHILIDLLIYGDDSAADISSRTNHHRNSITTALKGDLTKMDLVNNKGSGVYELSGKGRSKARALARSELSLYEDSD